MSDSNNWMDALNALMEERNRYEQWLAQLDARKGTTPTHVFARVRADYDERLTKVLDQLAGRATELQSTASTLAEKVAALYADETTLRGQVSRGPAGEWNLYWAVAGLWGMWSPRVLPARDGQLVRGRQVVDVYVPRRTAWQVLTFARECDAGSQAFSDPARAPWPCPSQGEQAGPGGDDVPGVTVDLFRTPELGLGLHRGVPVRGPSTCPPSNPRGCYQLEYVVTRVG